MVWGPKVPPYLTGSRYGCSFPGCARAWDESRVTMKRARLRPCRYCQECLCVQRLPSLATTCAEKEPQTLLFPTSIPHSKD